jgi:hypothetical protein
MYKRPLPIERIRNNRNIRLQLCDWTQMPDSPLSSQQRTAWAEYRQLLRDITVGLPDPLPENYRPIWPAQPS